MKPERRPMAGARTHWWRAGALTIGLALAVSPVSGVNASTEDVTRAPLLGVGGADSVAGRYVVVLENGSSDQRVQDVAAAAEAAGGTVRFTYRSALKGFSAALPAAALEAVRTSAGVSYVEADARVTMTGVQPNPPSWGLHRVDQRDLPLDTTYNYVDSAGSGVDIYVIDTGIRFSHNDFGGRATSGIDLVDGGTADDCNGHGTHVAGTAGGSSYGVAKQANLIAVRVFGCSGGATFETIIAAVDWVTDVHSGPSVANMSLSGGYFRAMNDATTNSINAGVVHAVAAGNSSADACSYSPASTPKAITLGASTITDRRSGFSNYGACVDLFAPGDGITSAWWTSDSATAILSGTSMASPHAAGVAALYLGENPGAGTGQVARKLKRKSSKYKLSNIGTGSPNKLLYSRVDLY